MAVVKPFCALRPRKELAAAVAALPYDVYSRKEACLAVRDAPLSFLNIDRAETQFGDEVDTYADCVYEKARELLQKWIGDGTLVREERPCYYIYRLIMDGRAQTGIVGCSSIDDYQTQVIRKHENTREEKELDRIRHVDTCGAQTGPIFLAYRGSEEIRRITERKMRQEPLYDFVSEDGVRHTVWRISEEVQELERAFEAIPNTYIADGHHRAASAVKVGLMRRSAHPEYTGTEESACFLSVLFPQEQLMIMPYNRVVRDLNGCSPEAFPETVRRAGFTVERRGKQPVKPVKKGTFGMYLGGEWYLLEAAASIRSDDPVEGLDVSVLQNHLLAPVLGIQDPRTDRRIEFVGGIRGVEELVRRADECGGVAFSMFATSIEELFAVADAGQLMPPKSTWFEPKLRSGLFIHEIGREG